jgi:hypothetical protein
LKRNDEIFDELDDEIKDGEYDAYTSYEEAKSDHADLDPLDPKIFEGNLIDKKSQSFIANQYKECPVFDLSEIKENDKSAEKTIEILRHNDNVVLFQPAFIYKNKAIAKLDALVKSNNNYTLIEVKGTSRSKKMHLLDVYYQTQVANYVLKNEFNNLISDVKLCLVSYETLPKNEISFTFTDYLSEVGLNGKKRLSSEQYAPIPEHLSRIGDDGYHARFFDLISGMIPNTKSDIKKKYIENFTDQI